MTFDATVVGMEVSGEVDWGRPEGSNLAVIFSSAIEPSPLLIAGSLMTNDEWHC